MAKELRLVLVTPETTLLDEPVTALRFPLFDGQIGIMPGRAPMVGRLGYGELSVATASGNKSYFIDGGFVQVKGTVVSLLTDRAIASDELDKDSATTDLAAAMKLPTQTDDQIAARDKELQRTRSLLQMTK